MDRNTNFVSQVTRDFLKRLAIDSPTPEQINAAESFIVKVIFEGKTVFDGRLSPREVLCLYWTAKGKSSIEVSEILHISRFTVYTHKTRIMKKLKCKSMAQAVHEGMKHAYLLPNVHKSVCKNKNDSSEKYSILATVFS